MGVRVALSPREVLFAIGSMHEGSRCKTIVERYPLLELLSAKKQASTKNELLVTARSSRTSPSLPRQGPVFRFWPVE